MCLTMLIYIYMYCDSSSSPTKGTELFGVSFEFYDYYSRIPYVRRYMPFIALQRDFLDAAGKAYALLWCVWLLVGPTIAEMARFCNQVKGLVTDMGTERLLPRMIDILDLCYEIMLGRPQPSYQQRASLFPSCIAIPGWQHGWDVVLKRSLNSLPFFPSFLDGLRAMVSFFRAKILVELVVRRVI